MSRTALLVPGKPPGYIFATLTCRSPMRAVLDVILVVLQIYIWLLIAAAVLSWLLVFNVVNRHNRFVEMIGRLLFQITEPVLRPIRNLLPNLGGFDISPVILILALYFIRDLVFEMARY